MTKRIVLTGGGTAGHVVVNLALLPRLEEEGWEIHYIGSETGIEKSLLADYPQVTYHGIPTGKLRRDLSIKSITTNVRDMGHVISGVHEARKLMKDIKPHIVFSKGGFVSVPVVLAAHSYHVPIISHESDLSPGLANKITAPFVKRILVTFESTAAQVPAKKAFYLGPVIRPQLKGGSVREGRIRFGMQSNKPILLVLGGSLGAEAINRLVWENLDELLKRFEILHGVGANKGDSSMERPDYHQIDYIKAGMNDALAMADVVVSRAGSNAIFEFLYYHKPMLLIPYWKGSRGDQVENAREFARAGYAKVLDERKATPAQFLQAVTDLMNHREAIQQRQRKFEFRDGVETILSLLEAHRLPF